MTTPSWLIIKAPKTPGCRSIRLRVSSTRRGSLFSAAAAARSMAALESLPGAAGGAAVAVCVVVGSFVA